MGIEGDYPTLAQGEGAKAGPDDALTRLLSEIRK
jgi:hypothetical protein